MKTIFKYFNNPFFHIPIVVVSAIVMIIDVIGKRGNGISLHSIIGKIAGGVFMVDICAVVLNFVIIQPIRQAIEARKAKRK